MAIFGSGLLFSSVAPSRAGLLGAVLSGAILLGACTDGTTPACGADAGCGYPLVDATLTDGAGHDGGDAGHASDATEAASPMDAGGETSTDAPGLDAPADAPSADAAGDAVGDSPTQG
jgi:hypothetical protein